MAAGWPALCLGAEFTLLRQVECPVVLLEPYVANSAAAYRRLQAAWSVARGVPPAEDDILVEYAAAVVAAVLQVYAPEALSSGLSDAVEREEQGITANAKPKIRLSNEGQTGTRRIKSRYTRRHLSTRKDRQMRPAFTTGGG